LAQTATLCPYTTLFRSSADAFDVHVLTKDETPVTGSYCRSFTRPQSTTYLIFGIVSDVSATFVATTHSRVPSGGSANTRICCAEDRKSTRLNSSHVKIS